MRAAKVQAMRRAGLILPWLVLIFAAGIWRPASTFAKLPAGTPTYNVNGKWAADRGSQDYTCTAAFCGSALYSPSGSSGGGITWIQNSNLAMNCNGNSVDWQFSSNHLTISPSLLQSWSQFGMRTTWATDVDGWTHFEQGNCLNPLNDGNGHALGSARLIVLGANGSAEGPAAPGGVVGTVFSANAVGGTATCWCYVVGHTADGHVTAASNVAARAACPLWRGHLAREFLRGRGAPATAGGTPAPHHSPARYRTQEWGCNFSLSEVAEPKSLRSQRSRSP